MDQPDITDSQTGESTTCPDVNTAPPEDLMTTAQVADALGLKRRWTQDLIQRLAQEGAITLHRDSVGHFKVNRADLPKLLARRTKRGPAAGTVPEPKRQALETRRTQVKAMLNRLPRPSAYQIARELGVAVGTIYSDLSALGESPADQPEPADGPAE